MRILLGLISLTLLASDISTFEVKELDNNILTKLNDASSKLDQATEELKQAQKKAEDAKSLYDGMISSLKNEQNAFEGQCSYPNGSYYSGSKSYRRVEIRGKYLLISTGIESCSNITITGTYSPVVTCGSDGVCSLPLTNEPIWH